MEEMKLEKLVRTEFAGFWVRLIAFAIDIAILSSVLHLIGILFYNYFSSIGYYGRIFGFALAVGYFGILNCNLLTNGQTIGKRLLKIRVVDSKGNPITIVRSIARIVVLIGPYLLSNLTVTITNNSFIWFIVLGIVVSVVMSAVIFYYVFNFRNRQSIHDILTNTYVVPAASIETRFPHALGNLHFGYGIVAICIISVLLYVNLRFWYEGTHEKMKILQKVTMADEAVFISLPSLNTRTYNNEKSVSYIDIGIIPRISINEMRPKLLTLYSNLRKEVSFLNEYQALQFTLISGYDLGLASTSSTFRVAHSMSEWDSIATSKTKVTY